MRLTLLRHAEAVEQAGARDLDRPLTPFGHESARSLGAQLARTGFAFDRLWVSPAVRATETVVALGQGFGRAIEPQVRRAIYLASAAELLDLLSGDAGGGDLMMVGHNPGMQALAIALARPDDPLAERIAAEELAPCALVELCFDAAADGRGITAGTGRAERFVPPRPA